jgi:hypothetical protein
MPISEELTKVASGSLPISQAVGTDICVITDPGTGRCRVWGTVRHTLADGCRLLVNTTIIATIPNAPNTVTDFGPIVLDLVSRTDDVILELAVATGGADTASGILYVQEIVPN